jgi:ribosomal protein L29
MRMKKKEKQSMRSMKEDELVKKVAELNATIAKALLERTVRPAKNTRSVFQMRKNLAVVKSILKEKQQEAKGK